MKSLTPGIRYRIGAEASKKYPNSLRDARQDEKRKAYIEGAIDEATLCQQKDEEIARLREALEWYAEPGNYLDENSNLATAWKMDENIANKAKKAIK